MLKEKLESFGIPCSVVSRKNGVVELSNYANRKKIKIIQPKNVDIKVYGNKKLRQAVLSFQEPEQVIKDTIYLYSYEKHWNPSNEEIFEEIKRRVAFSPNMKISLTSEILIDKSDYDYKLYVDYEVKYPERTNSFLVGFDESHTFISQLPEPAKSVKQAHEILRPNVSEYALRSGEWFFDPIDEETEIEILSKATMEYTNEIWYCEDETLDSSILEELHRNYSNSNDIDSRNHEATAIYKYKDNIYACGLISDVRNTHKPLLLKGLHRVVRNREVINISENWD